MSEWISTMKPEKTIVREWQMDDLLPELEKSMAGRSFSSGQAAFRDAGCVQCHRFASAGGTVGPDLSGIARRQSARELLESIVLPSKVISDEYAAFAIETDDGEILSGRIEREDADVLVLRPAAFGEVAVQIEKTHLRSRQRSDVSNMPAGVVNVLQKEQILDLLAYLLGDGNPEAKVFH